MTKHNPHPERAIFAVVCALAMAGCTASKCSHGLPSSGRVQHWAFNGWILLSRTHHWLDYALDGDWELARIEPVDAQPHLACTNLTFRPGNVLVADGQQMEYAIWVDTWSWEPVLVAWSGHSTSGPFSWPPDPDLGEQLGSLVGFPVGGGVPERLDAFGLLDDWTTFTYRRVEGEAANQDAEP